MWTPTRNKKYGVVIYSYSGNIGYGLPLEIGDTVQILEECGGWFRGISMRNKSLKGIFPATYIHLKPYRVDNEGQYESVTSLDDPIVREIASVLREWHNMWKKLYLHREENLFNTLRKVMRELIDWRRQLICGTLTLDQIREIKVKITTKIDWGNRKLGLDLVPRVDSEMVDGDAISIVELYQVHVRSTENSVGTSARGTVRRKEPKKALTHHLYFCMRDFGYSIGEDTEVYFSLYDARQALFISERFLIKISKEGFSNYVEKLQNYSTLFTDLGSLDLNRDLYIVAHVLRTGRMIYGDSSKKSSQQMFKRPHGCAVLSLADVLIEKEHSVEEKEFSTKVYFCSESEYYQLHEYIIKKQSNKCSLLSGQPNYGIVVSVKMLHGEMAQVREDNPLIFKNITITHKTGFSDVIMPGDVRNDLYFHLDKGEFEKGGKSTGKNIEVTLSVIDADGVPLKKCISIGAGHENVTEYQSVILYHNNSPRWGETIKLAVPIERFYGSHVRMEFRHCSTRDKIERKSFGFAFAKLMNEDGTTIKDGSHELYVYKCEDRSKLLHPQMYLNLPWSAEDQTDAPCSSPNFQRSSRETVFLETLLCSTKLTQNVDLLSLLKWKAYPDKIQETLAKVMKLNGEEIVKFLQDILDALFQMFSCDGNLTPYSGQVFQALISIFSLLEDSKFEHFKPVMDTYITGHFAAALVYKGLLTCVQKFSDLVPSTDQHEIILRCFRSLEYILKFIIQSRLLLARAIGVQNNDSFRADMDHLFSSFKKMLSTSQNAILPTQVALLMSFSRSYDQLLLILPVKDVAEVVNSLLDSLPNDCPSLLLQAKLHCIKETIHSKLFQDFESRILLLQMCSNHLKLHLSHRQELKICAEIFGEVLTLLYKEGKALEQGKIHNCIHHEVQIIVVTTLDVLIQTVLCSDRNSGISGQLVTCLVALLNLMNECHYRSLWNEGIPDKSIKEFLLRVFKVFYDLVRQDVFPKDWMVLKMVTNYVILTALEEFSQLLIFHFLTGNNFDDQLWSNYFNLAVAFLTQPSLQLENFSEVKREKIIEKYQDMRVLMGFQILSMWSKLGDHKINFIPSTVGPFLEVTLVPETELRKATLPIFFDMMDCERKVKGNFKQVESELIDKLDILVSENKGDDEYRQLFNTMEHLSTVLLDRVKSDEPTWKENGTAFINSVTRLLERLLDYRNVMEGDENRDKRMSCTVNLLNFYKNEINRKEMYIRYIYKLHDLHLPAENYTEAASTLKLHADQLTWSKRILHADLRYPAQPEWQRKETLYLQIIEYFDKGKCWEKGIPLCKELAELYEKQLYDYNKLSHVLRTEARFFDNILTQLRPEPEYFRVGFYGMSFPLFVRNKLFIYRGLEYERIGAFTQRLQMEFPAAQILMKNTPPDDSIMQSDCQYIQICNVRPIPENVAVVEDHDIPEKIASFYLVNDVSTFQFDRPVHKEPIDKDNEFKSLWIERTTLVTTSTLPGILRWFEVMERRVQELSPIEYACETMTNVNQQLRQLINLYSADPKRNINPLSMRLQGIIDAAVMGGISKYQEAFFGPDFSLAHPHHIKRIEQLKNLIIEQVHILEGGLSLHGRLAPNNVQPLHKRLVECFHTMKQSIKESGSPNMARLVTMRRSDQETLDNKKPISIVNTPLPPIPVDKKSLPLESTSNRSSSSGSSVYGQLIPEDPPSDEDIYSKPAEWFEYTLLPPPLTPQRRPFTNAPPVPSRPWSAILTRNYNAKTINEHQTRMQGRNSNEYTPMLFRDHEENGLKFQKGHFRSKTSSPKLSTKYVHTPTSDVLRNSWSETSCSSEETAPPLPPRLNERRATTTGLGEDPPPALPRRLVKKTSAPTLLFGDLLAVDINLENDTSRSTSPESNSTGPPPIPLKKNLYSPSTGSANCPGVLPLDSSPNHQLTPASNPTTPLLSPCSAVGYSIAPPIHRTDSTPPSLPSNRSKPPVKSQAYH